MKRQILLVALVLMALAVTASAQTNPFMTLNDVVQQDTPTQSDYNDDFVFGAGRLDYDGTDTGAKRFFFDKDNGAFRAGKCNGAYWDSDNIGDNGSFAVGNLTKASGYSSHAEGNGCFATGNYSHAEGSNTQASGEVSHAEGYQTHADGEKSHAEGDGTQTDSPAIASHTEGCYSKAQLPGQHSNASGEFSGVGDAQYSQIVMRHDTTSASPSELAMGEACTSRAVLPGNTTWVFQVFVAARQAGGGDSAGYKIEGVIKRDDSNNTTLVGNTTKTVLAEDQSAWDADVDAAASDNYDALVIKVTGEADKTIRWVATVHLTEVGG